MTYKQFVGLSYGQKIIDIKDANGNSADVQINLIMEVSKDVPCIIGDPVQKFLEIVSDRPFGFKILDENDKFVCQMFATNNMELVNKKQNFSLNCFNMERAARRVVEVLSQEAVPVGALNLILKQVKKLVAGYTLITTERTINPTLLSYLNSRKDN